MKITLVLLILLSIADVVTTLMVFSKHSSIADELEINPLFVLGFPIWAIFLVKTLMIGYIIWVVVKFYYRYHPIMRYLFVYSLVILILITFLVSLGNLSIYNKNTSEIIPIPKEQRGEVLADQIGNMEVANNVDVGYKPPLILTMFVWNFIIFLLWYDSERKDGIC